MATISEKFALAISCILILFSVQTRAQNNVHDLDEKFRLEKVISERLEHTLQTRLEKDYFDVSVEVKIRPLPTRGLANIETESNRPYETESVTITLGLSDQVKNSYKESLRVWLSKWTQTSFGEKGSFNVVVRASNKAEKVIPQVKTSEFDISRYQNLIGLLFVGLVFGASFLYQFARHRKASTSLPQGLSEQPLLTVSNSASETTPLQGNAQSILDSVKTKIALLTPSLPAQVEHMVQKWSYGETENHIKLIAFIEALAEKSSSLNRDNKSSIPTLAPHMHAKLAHGLIEFQNYDPHYQLSLYQEIYTELLLGSPLAIESMAQEYRFIEQLADTDFQNLIAFLDDTYKVALLNHLTNDQRRQFCALVGEQEFSRLLNHSLNCKEPSETEFNEKINEWHKDQKDNFDSHLEIKFAKIEEIISSFSRLEEARFLHQLVQTQPEILPYMQRQRPQIAFMAHWSSAALKKFCHSNKTRELAAAAVSLPFLHELLLKNCGPSTRIALELEILNLTDPTKIKKSFEDFVNSFDLFARTQKLNISSMEFEPQNSNSNSKLVS